MRVKQGLWGEKYPALVRHSYPLKFFNHLDPGDPLFGSRATTRFALIGHITLLPPRKHFVKRLLFFITPLEIMLYAKEYTMSDFNRSSSLSPEIRKRYTRTTNTLYCESIFRMLTAQNPKTIASQSSFRIRDLPLMFCYQFTTLYLRALLVLISTLCFCALSLV